MAEGIVPTVEPATHEPVWSVSGARLEGVLDTAVDGIMVIDDRMCVLAYNKACERLFGYSAPEILGQNVALVMPSRYAHAHDGYVQHYLDTGEKRIIGIGREVHARHKDGTEFPVELSVGEAVTPDGRQFIGILRDLRPRKQMERSLAQAQAQLVHMTRISAIDEMGAAIAHELNQPLTAVLLYLQAVVRKARDTTLVDAQMLTVIEKAMREAERAGDIIQRMRQLVEKREPERTDTEIASFARSCVELVELGSTDSGVSFSTDVPAGLPVVPMDQVQIRQVLINLLRNAREAVAGSAVKRVRLQIAQEDGFIEFRVQDSGPGVPKEVMPELFRAFSSHKRKGLGLGLAISRTIAQNHGGDLVLRQAAGEGATFVLRLPVECGIDTDD
ncbi:PAS domain S-box protein [Microvirga tunisiensis]|uniref:PAS domain S-box protein n=2 Tax=Pannonibacter tanglangensis TaxID=2750084 RepID=A0ABW9ZHB4_9HYPH|nr:MULTISPECIES: PAS domain S-box protein [unclassified Pannonibacter]NBN64253.1 PAS domain S-box protein [Pannonibacter sp. XCT-34]NBN78786.1 PAS domain S-box protein [Pannonibacter sp. XCT-53]